MSDLDYLEYMGVVPVAKMLGDDPEETFELKAHYSRARAAFNELPMVKDVGKAWFGGGVGKIIAVFLFEFRFEDEDDTKEAWFVYGDVPWMFTAAGVLPNSKAVLAHYIERVRQWNRSGGEEPEDCLLSHYHPDWADRLESRLAFIEKNVLPIMPTPRFQPT